MKGLILKYIFCSVTIWFGFVKTLYSQDTQKSRIDTIYVSVNQKTYVALDETVNWADPGIPEYLGEPVDKTLFLTASAKNLQPASLIINYGENNYLHLTIAYKDRLGRDEQFVDLRDRISSVPELANEQRVEQAKIPMDLKLINRRLGILLGNPKDNFKQYAEKKHNIIFKLTNVMQDDKYFYIKTTLFNRSKIDYEVDFVDFKYIDLSDDLQSSHQAEILDKLIVDHIASKEDGNMVYAIKKYKLGSKGELRCTIREKDGSRTLSFGVDYQDLISSDKY